MSTTSLTTREGQGTSFSLYVDRDVVGATLTAEFATNSKFGTIALSKPLTATGRQVTISLTSSEVGTLKDCHFRVKSVNGPNTQYVASGEIDFLSAPVSSDAAYVDDQITNITAAIETETNRAIAAEVLPSGLIDPSFYNMKAWSFDPLLMSTSTAMTSGGATLTAVPLPKTIGVTNILVSAASVTSTVFTAGQNFAAVLDSNGIILAQTADLTSTLGVITAYDRLRLPLVGGPVNLIGGPNKFVYVLFMVNFTGTAPTYAGYPGAQPVATNIGLAADNPTGKYRSATASPVITAIPTSPVPMSSAHFARRQAIQWIAFD